MIAISEATDTSRSGRRNVGKRREKQMSFKALIGLPVLCLALVGCGDQHKGASSHKEEEKNEQAHEKEGSHEKKEEVITLSPEGRKNIRLVTTPATFNSVREKITATATISHNQDRLFHVTPPIDGRVLRRLCLRR